MSTSGSRAPERARSSSTWRAMRSRKLSPSLTSSSDLAFVIPMLVPRPPLSLMTTAWSSTLGARRPRQLLGVGDVGQRLDLGLAQQPGLPGHEPVVVVGEGVDGRLRQPLGPIFSTHSARPSVRRHGGGTCYPRPQPRRVPLLLLRRDVDLDAERRELEPGDLAVDGVGHRVHAGREVARRGATRCSTASAWLANDMSMISAGWPWPAARLTTRPDGEQVQAAPSPRS